MPAMQCTDAYLSASKSASKRPRNPRSLPAFHSHESCRHWLESSRLELSPVFSLLCKVQNCYDLDVASDLLSHWYLILAPALFSEAFPSTQIFGNSGCRQSASALKLHVFSSVAYPLAFPLPASCDPSCFFRRSGRRVLKDADRLRISRCIPFAVAAQRSGSSQPCQCLYNLIFTFCSRDRCGRQRLCRCPQ
jgi:hypothetical protein